MNQKREFAELVADSISKQVAIAPSANQIPSLMMFNDPILGKIESKNVNVEDETETENENSN